ncbi:hypothetical protein DQ04_06811020 [Trypanosoma grayi]|uniref:hypothetical protein n=1 Tax=Trypanosoma grayi TaxID=71804 RepID=UPI0004F47DBE|nr:hypothetical protein DQ04_06811020 [Trypanosoma grayi]KEG08609.1 hypothetical protein DQ04_06811020 [Trypanosoma grayi]
MHRAAPLPVRRVGPGASHLVRFLIVSLPFFLLLLLLLPVVDIGNLFTGAADPQLSTPPPITRLRTLDAMDEESCGREAMAALGVVLRAVPWLQPPDGFFAVDVFSMGEQHADVALSGRAVSNHTILHAVVRRSTSRHHVVLFGPLPTDADGEGFAVQLLLTWVGPRFLGQRWWLPPRNNNPPFAVRRQTCLGVELSGRCEQFGVTIYNGTWKGSGAGARAGHAAVSCTGQWGNIEQGHWRRLSPAAEQDVAVRRLLLDDIGLNQFNDGWWWWRAHACKSHVRDKADAFVCMRQRHVRTITLVGDSMMVEWFYMFVQLLSGAEKQEDLQKLVRARKWGQGLRARTLEYTAAWSDGREDSRVTVRLYRSYTTKHGRSVMLSPSMIVKQLMTSVWDEHDEGQLLLMNLAQLHFQQSMYTEESWAAFLSEFAELYYCHVVLRHDQCDAVAKEEGNMTTTATASPRPSAFFVGPSLIQMGRTQGLEPMRTQAFAHTARTLLERVGITFLGFPHAVTAARRESAFDGQHWACYHQHGGVAQMLVQTFLAGFCPAV